LQASTPEPTQQGTSVSAEGVELTLDNAVYMPTQRMEVRIIGVTDAMINAEAFASIYPVGGGHEDYLEYHYSKSSSETFIFESPLIVGNYEMRFYKDGENYNDQTLVLTIPFRVSNNPNELLQPAGDTQISLDKWSYFVNDTITVQTNDLQNMSIAIYQSGAAHSSSPQAQIPNSNNQTLTFNAPSEVGTYEMRVYKSNNDISLSTFLMSIAFAVESQPVQVLTPPAGAPSAPPVQMPNFDNVTLSIGKTTYNWDETIPITISGLSQEFVDTWRMQVGIYRVSNGTYPMLGAYAKNGTETYYTIGIHHGGNYEVHLVYDYTTVIKRVSFTVDDSSYKPPVAMGPAN
jgi:hypothetical protein